MDTKPLLKIQFLPSGTQALLTWEPSKAGWGGGRQGTAHSGFSQNPQTLVRVTSPFWGRGLPPAAAAHMGEKGHLPFRCTYWRPHPFAGALVVLRSSMGEGGGPSQPLCLLQPQESGS